MSIQTKIYLAIVILLASINLLLGQEKLWHEEVDAIIIADENEFNIINENRAKFTNHRIVQIYNDAGKKHGKITLSENRFVKIKKISGRILDTKGNEIRKLRSDEIKTGSYSEGFQLYSDSKHREFELMLNIFPYIVEFEYEKELNSLFFWPNWYPQTDIPVLKSFYKLILNENVNYQTHAIGIEIEKKEFTESGKLIVTWQLERIEPKIEEQEMPPENDLQMALLFAPQKFTIENFPGSFNTWDDFAGWYRSLTSGIYELPPDAIEQVQQLVQGIQDTREKVQKLYAFLQQYTRYVSIDLGIGGWKPYSAEIVYRNRYGDCKDLSTLMIALLKTVDIVAYPALVKTRDEGLLLIEFPSSQFNHVITVIPLQSDTLWLECTADLLPAGGLSSDVEGCDVAVIKQNCCDIIRIPQSFYYDNVWRSKIEGRLTSFGAFYFTGEISATGNQGIYLRNRLYYQKPEECKRWLSQLIGKYLPKIDLTDYTIDNLERNLDKPIKIHFNGISEKFGMKSAQRLFVNPNIINRETADEIPREEERHFPVYYQYAFMDIDSIVIQLPAGHRLEAAPEPKNIEQSFGVFTTSFSLTDGKLTYCRTFKCQQNKIPTSIYFDYLRFIKDVIKNDKSQFILTQVN